MPTNNLPACEGNTNLPRLVLLLTGSGYGRKPNRFRLGNGERTEDRREHLTAVLSREISAEVARGSTTCQAAAITLQPRSTNQRVSGGSVQKKRLAQLDGERQSDSFE
jgi:hypothetical protein